MQQYDLFSPKYVILSHGKDRPFQLAVSRSSTKYQLFSLGILQRGRCILKLFKKEKERNDLFIHYFAAKKKICEVLLHFFFLGNHGIKVTTTHFPGMSKRSWLTECHSNLFSFRGMIALKRRDSVDLETTTYQVDRALRDRRKKLVKRNTIADFYKHDVNSDSGTNGE